MTEQFAQLLDDYPQIIPFAFDLIAQALQQPGRPIEEIAEELRQQHGY